MKRLRRLGALLDPSESWICNQANSRLSTGNRPSVHRPTKTRKAASLATGGPGWLRSVLVDVLGLFRAAIQDRIKGLPPSGFRIEVFAQLHEDLRTVFCVGPPGRVHTEVWLFENRSLCGVFHGTTIYHSVCSKKRFLSEKCNGS